MEVLADFRRGACHIPNPHFRQLTVEWRVVFAAGHHLPEPPSLVVANMVQGSRISVGGNFFPIDEQPHPCAIGDSREVCPRARLQHVLGDQTIIGRGLFPALLRVDDEKARATAARQDLQLERVIQFAVGKNALNSGRKRVDVI